MSHDGEGLRSRETWSAEEVRRGAEEAAAGHRHGTRVRSKMGSRLWIKLSGEVREDVIYIYEGREDEAIRTIRHEFLDFLVSQTIMPYRKLVNVVIGMLNEDVYKKKERIVEALIQPFERECIEYSRG